jgi:Omp85 superfamily domain
MLRPRAALVAALLFEASVLVPRPAHADSDAPKRQMPDYDGRGEEPTTAGDAALIVPRVVLSPLYFTSEYIIRRPLGWLITNAERGQWSSVLLDVFTFDSEHKVGVLPTALLDFGFRPSVGIYGFWDDAGFKGNHLRLHAATWGPDWLTASFVDRIELDGPTSTVDLHVDGIHRPDLIFHGIGPSTREGDRSRFGLDRLDVGPVFNTTWWRGSRLKVAAGVRDAHFRDDACCGNPSVPAQVAAGVFAMPPGFERGYTIGYERLELTVDTREARPAAQSGVRVEVEAEQASDLNRATSSWVRYGGTVGGFLDLAQRGRIVSLSVTALFVDPIGGDGGIPFTEQIVLGGTGPMRGYLFGRLVDRSAAIATLKYRWPIWSFLDGAAHVAVGNVFGPQLQDFKPALLRLSSGIGIETTGAPDHTFEILAGFGTETFADNAKVDSFRLVFGANKGF